MVTSNHIHLLFADNGKRDAIPKSIQLIAGRTGQEYNKIKHLSPTQFIARVIKTGCLSSRAKGCPYSGIKKPRRR